MTSSATGSTWIFYGMAVGAAVKIILALLFLLPAIIGFELPVLPKAQLALELAPALLGVGFILGYRQSAVIVAGSLLSAIALTPLIAWIGGSLSAPLFPETIKLVSQMTSGEIWLRYVRYIGAGAVATAGIITVLRGLPTMAASFLVVAKGIRKSGTAETAGPVPDTDRDLPGTFVFGTIAVVVAVAALVPGVFAGGMGPLPRAICAAGVGVFGMLFVAVAARIVGIVGVSSQPTSGITLVTLLGIASIFAAAGWTDPNARAAVLTVGTIVGIAASKAGDISQDLKTGFLVGATPARQQFGQLIGASFACWAVAATVLLLGTAYTFGSQDIPAPQATLMKTIIEGVLAGALPWGLVLTGTGVALCGILCGVSGLAFAIGVYLPLSSMGAIYVGGCVRALVERARKGQPKRESDPGVLAASGMVAGEGLAGVLIAGLVARKLIESIEPRISGITGSLLASGLILAVCFFLYRAGKSRTCRESR
jgi:putative OPT family oligopeptide transporter